MKFKKLESGRSMVEMLGVLAIIGVLSVGGIAGYSLSMRRHRANQVVDYVAKHALMAYSLCQKKILDGTATTSYGSTGSSSSDIAGCQSTALIPDSRIQELGTPPAGVGEVHHGYIENNAETGIATVVTTLIFSDQKLCQSVGSVVGSTCRVFSNGRFILDIHIKQN